MDGLKDREFEEIARSIRHWENMRWATMTVFMAAMGAAISTTLLPNKINFSQLMLRLGSLMLAFIFWVQDERIVAYRNAFMERARQFEKENSITVYSVTPPTSLFSGGNAVRVLFLLFSIFWTFHFIASLCDYVHALH
jgi:hypothetical protein